MSIGNHDTHGGNNADNDSNDMDNNGTDNSTNIHNNSMDDANSMNMNVDTNNHSHNNNDICMDDTLLTSMDHLYGTKHPKSDRTKPLNDENNNGRLRTIHQTNSLFRHHSIVLHLP